MKKAIFLVLLVFLASMVINASATQFRFMGMYGGQNLAETEARVVTDVIKAGQKEFGNKFWMFLSTTNTAESVHFWAILSDHRTELTDVLVILPQKINLDEVLFLEGYAVMNFEEYNLKGFELHSDEWSRLRDSGWKVKEARTADGRSACVSGEMLMHMPWNYKDVPRKVVVTLEKKRELDINVWVFFQNSVKGEK